MSRRGPALFCLLAGGGDAVTGLLLVASPGSVLQLLGIAQPADGLVFLRFAGVFVGCVGLAYGSPWLVPDGLERRHRLRAAIEITAGFRIAVALFLASAVAAGALDPRWLLVGGYDALVAAVQLGLRARGFFTDATDAA